MALAGAFAAPLKIQTPRTGHLLMLRSHDKASRKTVKRICSFRNLAAQSQYACEHRQAEYSRNRIAAEANKQARKPVQIKYNR
jgi:hypothetical protein